MATKVVQDLKELPKDEPKLQKWSLYSLIVCVIVSVVMAVWYLIRLNHSGANANEPSWFWSIIHMVGYVAYAVVSGLGLFGAYYPKPQFINWYLIGSLAVIIAEIVCIFYNQIVVADKNKKFSIITVILKVAAIIVFIISAVLAFLWKRYLDNHPLKSALMENKTDQKVAEVNEGSKGDSKNGGKADKNKSKA